MALLPAVRVLPNVELQTMSPPPVTPRELVEDYTSSARPTSQR